MRIHGLDAEQASPEIDAIPAGGRVAKLLRQQAAIARFGSFALREWDMAKILAEAVRVCAEGLGAPFSKVCRYRADENDLLIVAGHGWRDGVVGYAVSRADLSSPQGRAFCTGEPIICDDLRVNYLELPPFYAAHGIVSTIDVIIKGVDDKPYGILEIDADRRQNYDQYDINFLTGFANVLAEAVATASRAAGLQVALDRTQVLVADKDALLRERTAIDQHLRQAQKMEAVGQLTGGVAHDLNNILTVIIGGIEILGEAVVENPQLASIAEMIDDAAGRGADLTRRLLAFARRQPLHPREIDINSLIIETTSLLQPTLGEHIEIRTALADDATRALIDASQLTNAILNLALNARDAMPHGGKLTIATSNVAIDDGHARMDGELAAGDYVLIEVSDSGQGISAAVLERVFEPFFTTKDVGKGTGLGLSMVYGFVKQSLGHITIHSEEGVGTTIRIYLPQASGTAHAAADVTGEVTFDGKREKVLVVEDDALVRTFVLAQIQSLGYATLTAANATEALSVIDGAEDIDVLFTDLIMPGLMNGRQLADEALRRRPALKVLFTSGYSEDAITHNGRLDAGVLLLAKPYRKSDLARMLRNALTSDIKLPPAFHPVAVSPDDPAIPPATAA